MTRNYSVLLAIAGLLFCGYTSAQVQRTFVASYGSDANTATNCGFAAPCRGFTAAQTVTQSGGEIIALDAAGYGAITITKSISIIANPGAYAGISAATGNAVTIATADVNVRLSGLKINGIGAANGIVMTNGASLTVENCTVSGFTTYGVAVVAPAEVSIVDTLVIDVGLDGISIGGGAIADVANTVMMGNGRAGLLVDSASAVSSRAAVTNSVASQNAFGMGCFAQVAGSVAKASFSNSSADNNPQVAFLCQSVGGGAGTLSIASSKATGNGTGFGNISSTFNSAGNNMVTGNVSNTAGVITNVGTM